MWRNRALRIFRVQEPETDFGQHSNYSTHRSSDRGKAQQRENRLRVTVPRTGKLARLARLRGGESPVFCPAVRTDPNRIKRLVGSNGRCCTRLRKKEDTRGASRRQRGVKERFITQEKGFGLLYSLSGHTRGEQKRLRYAGSL